MDDFSYYAGMFFYLIIVVLVIMLIRWRINRQRAFSDKQAQQMMDYAKKKADYEQKVKEDKEKREKERTIYVNPNGEAKRGSS